MGGVLNPIPYTFLTLALAAMHETGREGRAAALELVQAKDLLPREAIAERADVREG